MPLSYSRALQVIDFVGQLGKLRADGIGAPAPRMPENAVRKARIRVGKPYHSFE